MPVIRNWYLLMFARRCVIWLFLPLLMASLSVRAEPDGAAQALHLLGYLGADYPATVSAGEVVDAGEYREQLEFHKVLLGLVQAMPDNPEKAALLQGLTELGAAISARADGALVSARARELAARLVAAYQLSVVPRLTPDPARGAALFAEHCSVCHGVNGAGDGPAGIGLVPAPTDMHNRARLDLLSLHDLFNSIGLGVEGTDMPAFAEMLDERQRWDLASFIAGLSAGPASEGERFALTELASLTPEQVAHARGEAAAEAFRSQRGQPPAPSRTAEQLLDFTRQTLAQSLAAYREGRADEAYDLSVGAYLEGFELVEGALDNIDPALRKEIERALMNYRQGVQERIDEKALAERLDAANEALQRGAERLGAGSMSAKLSFFSSLLILLREGVEAILVLAAILAYLRNTGQEQALRSVHFGWGAALVAGVATWALAAYVIDVSGAQRELLEGTTALFASVVLLWVGVWMHDRRHAAAWQDYVKGALVGGGGRLGFAVLAFFAIYRELFEVILFYETLWLQAGPEGHGMVLAGAGAALALLAVLAWVILSGSRRLPISTFFAINAALLCTLAVVFAGHGVASMQEAGILGLHPVAFVEADWLGLHADAFGLAAQALVLTAVLVFYARSWLESRREGAEVAIR